MWCTSIPGFKIRSLDEPLIPGFHKLTLQLCKQSRLLADMGVVLFYKITVRIYILGQNRGFQQCWTKSVQ